MSKEAKLDLLRLLEERARRERGRKFLRMFPDEGPLRRELYPHHVEFFGLGKTKPFRLFSGGNGVGKALLHGTKVATPTGWVAIESLSIGDQVIAGDGSATIVTGVFPQGEIVLRELTFDGNKKIFACDDHQWVYQHPKARYPINNKGSRGKFANPSFGQWSVGKTSELVKFGKTPRRRVVVPVTKPFVLDGSPEHPYLVGLLLGDGCLTGESVRFSSADNELVEAFSPHFRMRYYGHVDYCVLGAVTFTKRIGIHGKRSEHKEIPATYLYANAASRLALLQGLMDSDGYVSGESGAMEYATCSDALADGFEWIAASLGMKTRRVRRQTKAQNGNGLPSWRIILRSATVCPFRLKRKAERWRPLRETGNWVLHGVSGARSGEATCISVAHESRTYVIDGGIVTHNTEGVGCYEVTCHATGQYPSWWDDIGGIRYDEPPAILIAGNTKENVRDIIQPKLIGRRGEYGTGMLPADSIQDVTLRGGSNGAIDYVTVKHVSGGVSRIHLKAYEMGQEAFMGFEADVIWLDEEPPPEIFSECAQRFRTRRPCMLITFTPLQGISEVVSLFMPQFAQDYTEADYEASGRAFVMCSQDEVPHLSDEEKQRLMANALPHEREARRKGVPSIGAGKIYPVEEESFVIKPVQLPRHWPRLYGLDVGLNTTAAVWGAWDRDADCVYLYSEHYMHDQLPPVHAAAIKGRGVWIPGEVDPASRGRNASDGEALLDRYRKLGLRLAIADNAVEGGIFDVLERLQTGRLKVFSTLQHWLREFRLYRRNQRGVIQKQNDHLMDASRYLIRGLKHAATPRVEKSPQIAEQTFGIYG